MKKHRIYIFELEPCAEKAHDETAEFAVHLQTAVLLALLNNGCLTQCQFDDCVKALHAGGKCIKAR